MASWCSAIKSLGFIQLHEGWGMDEKTRHRRPGTMRLIDAFQYRLPLAGVVSILHRISGVAMFALLPFIVWLFDVSLTSEISYARFTSVFIAGIGFVPCWFFKLVALA